MVTQIHFWDSGHNYEQGILVNDQIICLSTGEVIPVTEDVVVEHMEEWSPCVF